MGGRSAVQLFQPAKTVTKIEAKNYEVFLSEYSPGARMSHSPAAEPKTHTVECADPYFTLIKQGRKKVEIRKGTERWAKIRFGDNLAFVGPNGATFQARVVRIRKYE